MKRLFIILLCFMTVPSLQAQFAKPLPSRNVGNANVARWSVGLTGSYAANDMVYTSMDADQFLLYLAPTFGLAAEYNVMQSIGIGLDVSYVMRGTKEATSTTFLSDFNTLNSASVHYEMSLKGVEMRVPVTFYLGTNENVKPYVYLAPRVGLWLGDSIRWERIYDDASYSPLVYTHVVDKGTMKPYDVSMVAGFGLCGRLLLGRMPLYLKLDVNYGRSVFSTFSVEEVAAANDGTEPFAFHGWGEIDHEVLGRRYLQNMEARLTILIPIKKPLKDACAFDQRMEKGRK